MFGFGFGFGIKDKQGREAKFMMSLKIGSRLPLNHEKEYSRVTLKRTTKIDIFGQNWYFVGIRGLVVYQGYVENGYFLVKTGQFRMKI